MSVIPNPTITVILAGGKARRFGGQEKGEILIGDERLINIIHNRLLPQSSEVIVSGTHDYNLGLPVVPDIEGAPGGPVGGIYSIWQEVQRREVEGFFTVAVDGPNLPSNLMARLYSKNACKIAIDETGIHPTYAWWRIDDLSNVWSVVDIKGSFSLKRLAELTKAEFVRWDGDRSFININCPDDLHKM